MASRKPVVYGAAAHTRPRDLVTPEGVALRLGVADFAERLGALLLDLLIIFGSLFVFFLAASFAFWAAGFGAASELVEILWILGAFFLRVFYFISQEMGPRAATFGKRAVGLRVASRDGGRLTPQAVFARNAMRELEVFLPLSILLSGGAGVDGAITLIALVWSLLFALFPLFNRNRLRAGDVIAGTWVVRAPKRRLAEDLTRPSAAVPRDEDAGSRFTQEQLDAYGIKELQVLEDVLRAKDPKVMAAVAERIRKKIEYADARESDLTFLTAYYRGLRARLEARLLMGQRRKDKFDT